MTRRLRDRIRVPHLLAIALAVVLVTTAVVAGSTSTTAFGTYNSAWDGGRSLRLLADDAPDTEPVIAENTSAYQAQDPAQTTAFVLSPSEPYGDQSADRIERFVRDGGTLVVAGDFGGETNQLLAALGVDTRLHGALLRDEREHYRAPTFPIADAVEEDPRTSGVSQLTLNHATALDPGDDATVLVRTSEFAYLDTTENGELDDTETLASYPVVATETLGAGEVVVVSDPSVFINTMLDRPDNRAFATALVGPSGTVLFDYSHTAALPPLAALLLALQRSLVLQVGLVVVLALGLLGVARTDVVAVIRRRVTGSGERSPGFDQATVASILADRHPEWDRARVERVTQGIITESEQGESDGRPR